MRLRHSSWGRREELWKMIHRPERMVWGVRQTQKWLVLDASLAGPAANRPFGCFF